MLRLTYTSIAGILLIGSILLLPFRVLAVEQLVLENDSTRSFSARTLVIDQYNKQGNLTLKFGSTLNEQILWDSVSNKFKLTDDLDVQGVLSGSTLRISSGAIIENGRVGIGTVGPSYPLHVNSNDATATYIGVTNTNASAQAIGLFFDNDSTDAAAGWNAQLNAGGDFVITEVGTGGAEFKVDAETGDVNIRNDLTVAGGNVGIGTSAPETNLEIIGTASGTTIHAQNRLTSSGTLAIESGFYQEGMTDCDASTSKVIWDATTGTFTCGTDTGGSEWSGTGSLQNFFDDRFVNQSGDTMTGALTIDNEGSEPSLNVRGTASGQKIHAQGRLTTSGTLIVENTARLHSGVVINTAATTSTIALAFSGSNIEQRMTDGEYGRVIRSSANNFLRQYNRVTGIGSSLGNAVVMDGTGDYVAIGDYLDYERTDSFSIAGWVKRDTATTNVDTIVGKVANGPRGYLFTWLNDDDIDFYFMNNATSNYIHVTTTAANTSTEWTHVAVSYDGSSDAGGVTMYVNGSPVALTTLSNTLSATTVTAASLRIGARADSSQDFDGELDDIRIYGKELSAAEVMTLYNGGAGTVANSISELDGWWKFDESSGDAIDTSTNSNNGVLVNASRTTGKVTAADTTEIPVWSVEDGDMMEAGLIKFGHNQAQTQIKAQTLKFLLGETETEAMRITSGGLIGIGTTAPKTQLAISGSTVIGYNAGNTSADTSLEILGTASGQKIHAQDLLTSSGGLTTEGLIQTAGNLTINVDNSAADAILTFGNDALAETLRFSDSTNGFIFSDDVEVQGTASGRTVHAQDQLTSSGTLVIESDTTIDGTTFHVDSGNNRVGIGTVSPEEALDISGDLRLTNFRTRTMTRTIPTTVNDVVDIGDFAFSSGGGTLWVSVTVPSPGYSQAKTYMLPIQYDQTDAAWQTALPISSTGRYASTQDVDLDIQVNNATTSLRLRRSAGTVAGTAYIVIKQEGNNADTFTASTATSSVSAPTAFFDSTALTQIEGNVGIGDTSPDDLLNVHSADSESAIAITSLGTDTDAALKFQLTDNTSTFTIGVDDSDGDKFKISTTALGTNDRLVIDGGNVGIGSADPESKLDVAGTVSGSALTVSGLQSCDTIDTDANGNLSCGTDADTDTHFSGTGSLQNFFDNRFVNQSGDTMTGGLAIHSSAGLASTGSILTEGNITLNSDNAAQDAVLTFGNDVLPATLRFSDSTNGFIFSTDVEIQGTGSGKHLHAQDTLTSSGTLIVEGNTILGDASGDSVTVNAGTLDLSSGTKDITLNSAADALNFDSNTLSIDASNNRVGIGTANPKTQLYLAGSNTTDVNLYQGTTGILRVDTTDGAAVGVGGALVLGGTYAASSQFGFAAIRGAKALDDANVDGKMSFYVTKAGIGSIEYMTIDYDGNTGIGTTSADTKLEVVGTASGRSVHAQDSLTSSGTISAAGNLFINSNDSAADAILTFGNDALAATLRFSDSTNGFIFSTDVEIQGTGSGEHLHANRLLTGSGQVILESTGSYLKAAALIDVNGNGSGLLVDSEATTAPVLALDSIVEGASAAQAPHILFGYRDIFDTNLYRQQANRLRTDDDLWVGGTLSGSTLYDSQSVQTGSVLVSRPTGPPVWQTHTGSMLWYIDGPLSTGTDQGQIVTMPFALTVKSLDLRVKGDPGGSAIIVDINEAGTTIFSTRPEIDAGTTVEDGNHVFSDTSLAEGSEITIDIDQVGSGASGSGLTIMLHGIRQ